MIAAIPSPSTNVLKVGPLALHVYGLMIALGVVAAVWLCRRRWASWGHDPDEIIDLAYWTVPAGLVGARLYHVVTDFNRLYVHNLTGIFKIWDGGLGIPGGVLGGVLMGWWFARRRGMSVPDLLDMVAPAFPVAQAIGRWGNYFNQELFGRPTTLPWGLEIDLNHRIGLPAQYLAAKTFHPTFLYEMLWNLCLAGVLLGLDSRRNRGGLLPAAVVGAFYGLLSLGVGLDVLLVVQRQTSLGTAVQAVLFAGGVAAGFLVLRLLLAIDRRGAHRRSDLFVLYVLGYSIGRLWVESLRIDTANTPWGLRLNEWVSIATIVVALAVLVYSRVRGGPRPIDPPVDADAVEAAGVEAADQHPVAEVAAEGEPPADS